MKKLLTVLLLSASTTFADYSVQVTLSPAPQPSGVSEYRVYASPTGATGTFNLVASGPKEVLTVSNLTNDTYWFVATTVNSFGESEPSPVFKFVSPPKPTIVSVTGKLTITTEITIP